MAFLREGQGRKKTKAYTNHSYSFLPRLITNAQAGFCEGFHSPAYSVDFGRFTVDEFQQFDED
jgi:hypothetical protein